MEDLNSADAVAQRAMRLLPKSAPLMTFVVSGHLLVEERLTHVLHDLASTLRHLEDARLSFIQSLRLVQAFAPPSTPKRIWQFIEGLNSLRNRFAHDLEVPDIEGRLDALIGFIPEAKKSLPDPVGDRKSRFALAITVACGHLFGLRAALPGSGAVPPPPEPPNPSLQRTRFARR